MPDALHGIREAVRLDAFTGISRLPELESVQVTTTRGFVPNIPVLNCTYDCQQEDVEETERFKAARRH